MHDLRGQVDELATLMDEFQLAQASLSLSGFKVTFRRQTRPAPSSTPEEPGQIFNYDFAAPPAAAAQEPAKGQPVTSPMAGIFYLSSSPSSPPFVKIGENVSMGQTIGLIEAMKVFNEIPSPIAGTVVEILPENGALVQPGQILIRIG